MPDTAAPNYLDPQTLAAIGPLELRARMVVEGLMTGMHRSPHQGVSVEFAQHRPYTSGDDIRYLDWKVFGRTDKLYLKQYQKETNLDLVVLVDASGSMSYSSKSPATPVAGSAGAWRKYDHAACLGAAMSYLALRQQDRVGLMMFAGQLAQATRMSNVHDHWRTIVELLSKSPLDEREISQHDATPGSDASAASDPSRGPGTDLARVFDQLLAKLTQRSLLVLISDLFDSIESLERACARVAHRRHDLIVMQTLDHAERTFPFRGPSDFFGLEGEGRIGLDPAALRKAYLESLERHLRRAEEITRKFRFDYLLLDTSDPLNAPLSHFLAKRAAMISKGK
jgi:uncharacterized protein (DUF58 family)